MGHYKHSNPLQRSFATLKQAWQCLRRSPRKIGCQPVIPDQTGFRIFAGIVLFVILTLMVTADAPLVLWAREVVHYRPRLLAGFQTITHFGTSAWILTLSAAIGLLLSARNWRTRPRRERLRAIDLYADANFVFFTVAISGTTASLIKNSIGRARPKMLEQLGPHHFEIGAFEAIYASFPSGHSTTSGAVCMAMVLLLPRWWPFWVVLGLLGGVSRVAVGAHYPSDVLAGLAFGASFVLLAARWLAQRRLMFTCGDSAVPMRRRLARNSRCDPTA
ncbi:MAG: phosphatase PAP2 family protein [Rhizobiaceae bacterium]